MATCINEMKLTIPSKSSNESYARVAVSAFAAQLDPGIDELADIRTAVSEAVTNCIIHAYKEKPGNIIISTKLYDNMLIIKIRDSGCGIEDVNKAMEPLYTTGGDERAGLGFAVMQSFMDNVIVKSTPGKGTIVTMEKKLRPKINREKHSDE